MMKNMFLLLFSLILFAPFHTLADSDKAFKEEIIRLINQHRLKKNLTKLKEHEEITEAADKHSRNMAKRKIPFGHAGFNERINKLIKKIDRADAGAENVAFGSKTAEKVVEMWLNSTGHKKNIEGKFNLTGIGIARSKDGTPYFTQIFIHQE